MTKEDKAKQSADRAGQPADKVEAIGLSYNVGGRRCSENTAAKGNRDSEF